MDLAGVVAAGRKARADALALPGMAGRSEDELLLASNHPDLMCPCDLCPPDNYLVHDEDLVDLDVPCARFVAPTTLCPCGCGYVVPLYDNGTRGFCDDLPF